MRDLFVVAEFTIKEMVKRKSFIVSTLIILILIVIGFNIPNFLNRMQSESNTSDSCLIVDSQNIYEGTLESLNSMDLGQKFIITNESTSFEQVKEKMQNEEIERAILLSNQEGKIKLEYIVENIGMTSELPESFMQALTGLYSNLQLSKLGLTQEQVSSLRPTFDLEIKQIEEKEVSGNIVAIMLISIVLFYAIYFCAYQVSTSITTEKTSKIMETLVTSTTPKTIVLGKTIGIGIVGMIQIILIVGTALICANVFLDPEMVAQVLDMSKVTPMLGILSLIYFILGYAVYALLYALTGSTVSKPEDVQSANSPVAILAVVGFYLSYFTMMNPTSDLNVLASILPISSPFCMPFRILMGVATGQEIAISLIVLLVTILLVAHITIKIYSSAILNYGTKINFKDMIKMYKEKNN